MKQHLLGSNYSKGPFKKGTFSIDTQKKDTVARNLKYIG
jgi:hypothetical protein